MHLVILDLGIQIEREETEVYSLLVHFHRGLQQPRLDRSQELLPGLLCGWQGPKDLDYLLSLLKAIIRDLDGEWASQDTDTHEMPAIHMALLFAMAQ